MSEPNAEFQIASERFRITEDFLARYNKPGPRYTSYPTAPVWKEDFGPAEMESSLAASDSAQAPISLYMHLPYCEALCLFCACNVVISKDKSVAPPYLATLKKEIDHFANHISKHKRSVVQFHWGGGTPTYLSPAQMEDLFTYARDRFPLAPNAEIGVEVDPRVTSPEHFEMLRKLGFNRLSLGIQDFHPEVQQAIHRVQPYDQTCELFQGARALGFDSINVDLIYGLPFQTADRFRATVEQVLTLNPDRVAMFSYAHVPWLRKQQGAFATKLPEGMEKFGIFCAGLQKFLDAGYIYIGMDHFARPNDELAIAQRNRTLHRNFQGYTTKAGADLLGMGVSSISSIQNTYAQSEKDVAQYTAAVEAGNFATMRGYRLAEDDILRRAVINRLLCHTIINKREIETDFQIRFDEYFAPELAQLETHAADGLIEMDASEIRVTWLGRVFVRTVAMVFDAYLERQQPGVLPLFSKTL